MTYNKWLDDDINMLLWVLFDDSLRWLKIYFAILKLKWTDLESAVMISLIQKP